MCVCVCVRAGVCLYSRVLICVFSNTCVSLYACALYAHLIVEIGLVKTRLSCGWLREVQTAHGVCVCMCV